MLHRWYTQACHGQNGVKHCWVVLLVCLVVLCGSSCAHLAASGPHPGRLSLVRDGCVAVPDYSEFVSGLRCCGGLVSLAAPVCVHAHPCGCAARCLRQGDVLLDKVAVAALCASDSMAEEMLRFDVWST